MILRDFGIVIAVIIFVAAVGISAAKLTKKDDGMIEEASETIIENQAEKLFGLDDDQLRGRVDLTPWSPEDSN